jgi:ribosomal protein S18 acetylase RimI-like enzyme
MPPPLRAAAGHGVSYRPMTEEDRPFLSGLYVSTRAEEVAATGWPPKTQLAFLLNQFELQHNHYMAHYPAAEWLIVEIAAAPAGRLYLMEGAEEIRIVDISLTPETRGRGVGRAILEDLLDHGGSLAKPVTIHVEKNNPAMHLYRRLGFQAVAEVGIYDRMEWRPAS